MKFKVNAFNDSGLPGGSLGIEFRYWPEAQAICVVWLFKWMVAFGLYWDDLPRG